MVYRDKQCHELPNVVDEEYLFSSVLVKARHQDLSGKNVHDGMLETTFRSRGRELIRERKRRIV